jgi:hypothetical protein
VFRRVRYILLALGAVLATSVAGAQTQAKATRTSFKRLQWIVGSWRGSGGAFPSFFEEYRLVNDSTIQMRAFSDSTFRTATDSSMIEFRNGGISSRNARSSYVAIEVTPTSIRFIRPGMTTGGHTFSRVSADEWKATLHPAASGGAAVIYVMKRVHRQ